MSYHTACQPTVARKDAAGVASADPRERTVLLLRWVLIIATSYLVLFGNTARTPSTGVSLFVAAYFASNVLLPFIWRHIASRHHLLTGIVLFDAFAASAGLALTGNVSSDFFLLFFLVVFLGAVTDRLEPAVAAALVSSIAYLATISQHADISLILRSGYLVRVPFLFVVALFFGHLAQEEKRSRERSKRELMATISHDLKQPASVIHSAAELLLDENVGALNEEQERLIRRMKGNARRVSALSGNLLDAMRAQEGQLSLQRRPANLVEVVVDVLPLARLDGDSWGVVLEVARDPDLPAVSIDVPQMQRVVSNLLDNAIKYSPVGGRIAINVRAEHGEVVLEVHNDGPGIPPKVAAGLFDKYRRGVDAGAVDGAGLGLYIVKTIVDAHGGRTEVKSGAGGGTSVIVHLPITATKAPERQHGSALWRWWQAA